MSLKTEGSITFWLRHEHKDWAKNNSGYTFGVVRMEDISAEAVKHPDKSVEIKCVGPFDQSFSFRQLLPACDDSGLFVALTWKDRQVKLCLNGNEAGTQNALGST